MNIAIKRDGDTGLWIATNDREQSIAAPDLLDLAQMIKQVGWA